MTENTAVLMPGLAWRCGGAFMVPQDETIDNLTIFCEVCGNVASRRRPKSWVVALTWKNFLKSLCDITTKKQVKKEALTSLKNKRS